MPESVPKTLASPPSPETIQQFSGSGSECLNVDQALAFADGRFKGDRLSVLNEHVDRCPGCQQVVEEALRARDVTDTLDPTAGRNVTFPDNTIVAGRYRILRFVARGGMGEVYEAQDTELDQRVALKTVRLLSARQDKAVKRLKAEVQLARRVSHSNVCRIYDLGTHACDGVSTYFLTMEFVDGESLGRRIRRVGALPVHEVIALSRQLLLGLAAAHRAGVLHRDLKSDNVMLRPSSSGNQVMILDFGLARALDEEGAALDSSQNQGLVGTMGYMAPEQLEGKELGPRSDLYAFGVVVFEMLTGVLPFEYSSFASVLERLRRSAVAPSTLQPTVPPLLDDIVLRCLRRMPDERFASAEHALSDFDRLLSHPSVTTRSPAARRHSAVARRARAATMAVGALTTIGALALCATQLHRPVLHIAPATPLDRARQAQAATSAVERETAPAPSPALAPPVASTIKPAAERQSTPQTRRASRSGASQIPAPTVARQPNPEAPHEPESKPTVTPIPTGWFPFRFPDEARSAATRPPDPSRKAP